MSENMSEKSREQRLITSTHADAALPFSAQDLDRVRQPLPQSWTLPPTAYTNPDVFALEKKTLFANQWICVARVEQLPEAGDYLCVDVFDQPLVVVRGADQQLRALSRVCLHRAMPIAQGKGHATRFVCPYHHWTYELDGRLRSAPMMEGVEGFEATKCRLPELPLETWAGFVFVNLDTDAAPLAPTLAGLLPFIENHEFENLVVAETIEFDSPWNWKILVENFMEAYHHIGPHKHTFEPVYPARDSHVPDNGGAPWSVLRMPANQDVAGDDPTVLPKLSADQRRELLAICVYPTLLFAATASGGAWYQLQPTAHDQMLLKIHALVPSQAAEHLSDEQRQGLAGLLSHIHEEDIVVNQGPWAGLQAPLTEQGRLSLYEKSIWQLNQLWLQGLGL